MTMCAAILCLAVCINDTLNSYFTLKFSSSGFTHFGLFFTTEGQRNLCFKIEFLWVHPLWPVLYHQGSKKSLLRTDIFGTLATYNANLLHCINDDSQYFDTVCISDAMNKAGVAKVSDMSLVANLSL